MIRFLLGLFIGLSLMTAYAHGPDPISPEGYVHVSSRGLLKDYIVQDKDGNTVCIDPMAWPDYRDGNNYIVCE